MSNRAVKGFIFLVIFFLILTAIVMGMFVFSQPFVQSQMGIPDTGGAVNNEIHPDPSITPTLYKIPQFSEDVRGQGLLDPPKD